MKKNAPIIFLFFLTIIFFNQIILNNKTFFAFDTIFEYLPWSYYFPNFRSSNLLITDPVNLGYPFHQYVKNCIEQKIMPLWNNNNFCGFPTGAGGISAYINPVTLLSYLLLPITTGHDIVLWFNLFSAGIFMYLYLKKINLNSYSSLLGAVSWMFNGYIMVWFEFEIMPVLACSFPAALYFYECWIKDRKLLNCMLFICSIGYAVGSGFPHIIIFQFIVIGIYIFYRIISLKLTIASKRDIIHIFIVIFSVLCISSAFLVSHLSTLEDSQRPKIAFQELYDKTGQLPFKYLTTLIFPDFYGSPASDICFTPKTKAAQTYNNYNELCIYTGILTLLMSLTSILYLNKKEFITFYFFLAIISLTMAMGSVLYYPLAKFIPGLNVSTPTRILYVFGFSISVLAAIGADIISTCPEKKFIIRIFALWLFIIAMALGIVLLIQTDLGLKWALQNTIALKFFSLTHIKNHFYFLSLNIITPIALLLISILLLTGIITSHEENRKKLFLFLSLVIAAYDLITFGLKYNTASLRTSSFPYNYVDAIKYLKNDSSQFRIITFGKFMHNSFSAIDIQDIGGYYPFYPKRYAKYLSLAESGAKAKLNEDFSRWTNFKSFGSTLFDLINTKYILMPAYYKTKTYNKLKLVYDKEIKIFENIDCFPRVFFVPSYELCENKQKLHETILKFSKSDFQKKVILEKAPEKYLNETKCDSYPSLNINIDSYKSGLIKLNIKTPNDGFLVISENFHPNWVAKVNDKKSELFQANYTMMALQIKAGNHIVELSYQPVILKLSIIISILSWIIILITVLILYIKRK